MSLPPPSNVASFSVKKAMHRPAKVALIMRMLARMPRSVESLVIAADSER